jgi:hypothetical protein
MTMNALLVVIKTLVRCQNQMLVALVTLTQIVLMPIVTSLVVFVV